MKLLDLEMVELIPEEGLNEEIEQADGYKENVYHALIMVDKALNATPTRSMPTAELTPPPGAPPRGNKVKLPKLSLPHRSGPCFGIHMSPQFTKMMI